MGFRINTNIGAMNAHMSATMNNRELDNSLSRLSSGLRINKAADDASGMAIADSLRAQSKGLGQAINNANDGIAVAQTADGALDEYSNIIQTVRVKSIQAASDGQNTDSRAAIQSDITKLLEVAEKIATTTSFNGQKLLDGTFTNKNFQVGAYANETVGVSISSASVGAVGKLATSISAADAGTNLDTLETGDIVTTATPTTGNWAGPIASAILVNGKNLSGNLTAEGSDMLSAKGTADAINRMTVDTGVSATAKTTWTMVDGAVSSGTIGSGDLVINGVNIGSVAVKANDVDGALTSAINAKQAETGVAASVNSQGVMTLTAVDGRNIQVSNTSATDGSKLLNGGTTSIDNTSRVAIAGADASGGTTAFTLDGFAFSIDTTGLASADSTNVFNALTAAKTAGNISSNYTFVNNGNNTTITRTDGKDINIVMDSDENTELALSSKTAADGTGGTSQANGAAYNNARHGTVTLDSTTNISIQGDASTLVTFGLTNASASASGGLSSINVSTYDGAQTAIKRADSALKAINTTRSNLGSTQNQLESTIRNISVTQVNVSSAESQIRDVDFAAESANFSKRNILAQSGSYAMSQANAVQQNVLRLLQ